MTRAAASQTPGRPQRRSGQQTPVESRIRGIHPAETPAPARLVGVPAGGVSFTVPGIAYSKPRARVTVNGAYYPDHKGYERWQTDVQASLIAALCYKPEPNDRYYGVRATFWMRGKPRKDIDNLIGAVLDALSGIVWLDDKQVLWIDATKMLGATTDVVTLWIQPLAK